MTPLLLAAAATATPPSSPDTGHDLPDIPTSAPYNVPIPLPATPTYDGSGSTVHPDVVDMRAHGMPQWNGYRYWMAHTPFPNSNSTLENPSILASHDGLTWVTPPGVTNPIYPKPLQNWNSDTDLTYDPTSDELVLLFRGWDGTQHQHYVARSNNGVTWPATPTTIDWSTPEENLSPCLIREDGTWTMFGIGHPSRTVLRWTAPAPEGPWDGPVQGAGLPDGMQYMWHLDVIKHDGRYLAFIVDGGEAHAGQTWHAFYAATSTDGLTWTRNNTKLLEIGTGGWDDWNLYRGSIQPHENGTHLRVWYGGRARTGLWRVGYTEIPLSEWP